jgi:hypothetical protein
MKSQIFAKNSKSPKYTSYACAKKPTKMIELPKYFSGPSHENLKCFASGYFLIFLDRFDILISKINFKKNILF